MKTYLVLLSLLALGFGQTPVTPGGTANCSEVKEVLLALPNYSQLSSLLDTSTLFLNLTSTVTFLAPNNAALTSASSMSFNLASWIISGNITQNMSNSTSMVVTAIDGTRYLFSNNNGIIGIGGAQVIRMLDACNVNILGLDAVPRSGNATLLENIASDSRLTALSEAINASGIATELSSVSFATIFAPDDSAFDAMLGANATTNPTALAGILRNHIVQGVWFSFQLSGASIQTLGGSTLTFSGTGASMQVNGATILESDDIKSNGVLFIIDQVLSGGAGVSGSAPVASGPVVSGPVAPSASGPAAPSASGPAVSGPVVSGPAAPSASGPAAPSASGPVASGPVASAPIASGPVASGPAVSRPAVSGAVGGATA